MTQPSSSAPGAGRYAPSPSGDLHFGNLRTAVLAWLFARRSGRQFFLRVEDIDTQRSSVESAHRQIADLLTLGLDFDSEIHYQSQRTAAYEQVLSDLVARGLVYECYCSRREIQEASSAPHVLPGHYPGTCRELGEEERAQRRAELSAAGRLPALRLRADTDHYTVHDAWSGQYTGDVDDFVLRRGGRVAVPDWAYNFAVVIDDGWQGVDQVVRGDDLLPSAPRQAYLAQILGLPAMEYRHVPLVLGPQGRRLAKRDGAVTLRDMLSAGASVPEVVGQLAASIGVPGVGSMTELLEGFNPERLSREPVVWEG